VNDEPTIPYASENVAPSAVGLVDPGREFLGGVTRRDSLGKDDPRFFGHRNIQRGSV
jgi:hypothetical protein